MCEPLSVGMHVINRDLKLLYLSEVITSLRISSTAVAKRHMTAFWIKINQGFLSWLSIMFLLMNASFDLIGKSFPWTP
jgi:hypothetical protein